MVTGNRTNKETVYETVKNWPGPDSPTLQRVAEALGVSKTTIVYYVGILRNEQKLDPSNGTHGGLRLFSGIERKKPQPRGMKPQYVKVPIVFDISAGDLIDGPGEAENSYHLEWLSLPVADEKHKWVNVFALKVMGDSMIDAGIRDGDIVLVRRDHLPVNGDIIAAKVTIGERTQITLKHYYAEADGSVTLKPANPLYHPRTYNKGEVIPAGVVIHKVPISSKEVCYERLYEEDGVAYKLPYKKVQAKQ